MIYYIYKVEKGHGKNMKVVQAALKFDNGHIFTDVRHADIYEKLHKHRIDITNFNVIEGFVTDTGNFVDRYEAKKIAIEANQLIVPEEDTYPALFSEDVW